MKQISPLKLINNMQLRLIPLQESGAVLFRNLSSDQGRPKVWKKNEISSECHDVL